MGESEDYTSNKLLSLSRIILENSGIYLTLVSHSDANFLIGM